MAKSTTIIRAFATGSSTADSVASLDVPEDGDIVGIHGVIMGSGMDADGDAVRAELSFLSTNQLAVNDARGSIMKMELSTSSATVASQTPQHGHSYVDFRPGLQVNAGERLHIHHIVATGNTVTSTFDIVFQPVRGAPRRTQRRR